MIKNVNLDELITPADVSEMLEDSFQKQVEAIQAGKIIKKQYAESTRKRRRYFGLQTAHVDLTGNDRYSRKKWRFLQDWEVKMKSKYSAVIDWNHKLSKTLLRVHTKRYGQLFRLK